MCPMLDEPVGACPVHWFTSGSLKASRQPAEPGAQGQRMAVWPAPPPFIRAFRSSPLLALALPESRQAHLLVGDG